MQSFTFAAQDGYLESLETIPEPHAFDVRLRLRPAGGEEDVALSFNEHEHGADHARDNNMRAAIVHVLADAAVSVLVITGLFLAHVFAWL